MIHKSHANFFPASLEFETSHRWRGLLLLADLQRASWNWNWMMWATKYLGRKNYWKSHNNKSVDYMYSLSIKRFRKLSKRHHLIYGVLLGTWNFDPASKSSSVLATGGDTPWYLHLQIEFSNHGVTSTSGYYDKVLNNLTSHHLLL